jgi:Flp pilus assembly protein TadG
METSILSSLRNPIRHGQLSGQGRESVRGQRQDGAVAVVFAVALTGLIGICGLALDLALAYNRQAELRNVADAAALGAARRLNGTASGIDAAVAAAAAVAGSMKYQYNSTTINWSATAITFSTSPDRDGSWVDAGTAAATAERISYVRVDTRQLDGAGDVQTLFMPVLSSAYTTVTTNRDAIAGRTTIDVAPLAICAMSEAPASPRNNPNNPAELVEYGFRRGISYDLMNLNPGPGEPANFVVNPLAPPGTPGSSSDVLPLTVGPYVCTGTLGIPRLADETIAVVQPFPIGSLYKQLNSRFDQYEDNLCHFHAAPPDTNIMSYVVTSPPSTFPWMNIRPDYQTAAPSVTAAKRQTFADLAPPSVSVSDTAAKYGPVWAYAKAVPYSAYALNVPEPYPNGYTPFLTASWSKLYGGQTVTVTAGKYPTGTSGISTPYNAVSGVNFSAPNPVHKPAVKGRRVLNVPLLACPVPPGGSATVLAIGKFFMTVPATKTVLAAEFAGAVQRQNVGAHVELFP